MKQWEMAKKFEGDRRPFFISVRDGTELRLGGVDLYLLPPPPRLFPQLNAIPLVRRTNVNGAMNVIEACIDKGVKRVVALSTDKASSPIHLYGATKLASDKLFVAGNAYSGEHGTRFAVVRYGNVMGSRGSVIPFFLSKAEERELPITDERMTRFMISLEQGVDLVWTAFEDMEGGEIYVKKFPIKITEIARQSRQGLSRKSLEYGQAKNYMNK